MREVDSMLLGIDDRFLSPQSKERKKKLQKEILERRDIKTPLLALQDDRKNRFTKHKEVVDARRRNTSAFDARVAKREADLQRWHQSDLPRTIGGTLATADLLKLKAASDASRLAPKRGALIITQDALDTLKFCVDGVMRQHADFFVSDFNAVSLNNCVQTLLGRGWEAGQTLVNLICPRLVEEAFQECLAGNHFELPYLRDPATGARIRKRGAPVLVPPTLFPKYTWPDEAALLAQEDQAEAVRLNSAEAQRALQLTFDELQAKVRAGYKRGGNEDVR